MSRYILILGLALSWCPGVLGGEPDMGTFIGQWEVDFDRTLEKSKQSPKYDE